MLWILASLLLAAQDTDELIDRLDSADVQERDKATVELMSRGRQVVPALKKRQNDPNLERRGRIREAIAEIERRERITAVRPSPKVVSYSCTQKPLPMVLAQVFAGFGLRVDPSSLTDPDIKDLPVTIAQDQVSLWKAQHQLETAAGVAIEFDVFNGVRLQVKPRSEPLPNVLEAGDVRIRMEVDARGDSPVRFNLVAALPAGSAPSWWDVKDFQLKGERGTEIEVRREHDEGSPRSAALGRRPGRLKEDSVWEGVEVAQSLKEVRRLQVSGTLVLCYPHDVERHELDVRQGNGPFTKQINGVTCTFATTRDDRGEIRSLSERFIDSGEGHRQHFLIWFEDAEGNWLGDEMSAVLGGSKGESGGGGGLSVTDRSKIARLVLAGYVGEDRISIPFAFKDVPVKAARPK
jgi:hypothetical protein